MVTFTVFLVHKRPHAVRISRPTNAGLPDHIGRLSASRPPAGVQDFRENCRQDRRSAGKDGAK